MSPLVAGQQVIYEDSDPLSVLAESDLVGPLFADGTGNHYFLDQVFPLSQNGQGAEQPAVPEYSLRYVGGERGTEHSPGHPAGAVGHLAGAEPLGHLVLERKLLIYNANISMQSILFKAE